MHSNPCPTRFGRSELVLCYVLCHALQEYVFDGICPLYKHKGLVHEQSYFIKTKFSSRCTIIVHRIHAEVPSNNSLKYFKGKKL